MKGAPTISDIFLGDLYDKSNNKIPQPNNQSFSQYSEIDTGVSLRLIEFDIPDWFNLFDIESSLLDHFDNNSIIEHKLRDQDIESNLLDQIDDNSIIKLELRDQGSKHPLQWQLASVNDLKPSGFDEIGEVIKASLGFQSKP